VSWLAIPLGVVSGVVMGALGGGGAILTIPVLIYLLHLEPHTATTASLVIVGVSALVSVAGQLRHGTVQVADAVLLAVVGSAGTYLGSRASAAVSPSVLVVLLASLLAVVAALMLRHAGVQTGDGQDVPHRQWSAAHAARIAAIGVAIGALTGFFGVGGGFAIVPALTLVLHYPVRHAVGTSLLVIALNSTTAFLSRIGDGVDLDWSIVGTFTAAAVVGALVGGALGRRTSPERLSRAFAILLLLVAAYMLVSSVLSR
jgi:uncharacterized membrane protein YfcA